MHIAKPKSRAESLFVKISARRKTGIFLLRIGGLLLSLGFAALSQTLEGPAESAQDRGEKPVLSINHFIPHVSTVAANQGKLVGLFVRERVEDGWQHRRPAVLMLHGSPISSTPAFDLPFEDYSWMAFLARAGFDVFAMDVTGYGLSPTPMMDDPCNASATDQTSLLQAVTAPCPPRYPFHLTTSQTEWDEIDTVVDYIRRQRNVSKVNLIGWSLGGPRVGGYAARHPEKVDKLILSAPVYNRSEAAYSPSDNIPEPGAPLSIRTMQFNNWDAQLGCPNQFEPAIRDAINSEIRNLDPLAATWGVGLYRAPVQNTRWGWNAASAQQIEAPTLIIRGTLDTQVPEATSRDLYADLAVRNRAFVRVACSSHFLLWENQHMILLRASEEWLRNGTFAGFRAGFFLVDTAGRVRRE